MYYLFRMENLFKYFWLLKKPQEAMVPHEQRSTGLQLFIKLYQSLSYSFDMKNNILYICLKDVMTIHIIVHLNPKYGQKLSCKWKCGAAVMNLIKSFLQLEFLSTGLQSLFTTANSKYIFIFMRFKWSHLNYTTKPDLGKLLCNTQYVCVDRLHLVSVSPVNSMTFFFFV